MAGEKAFEVEGVVIEMLPNGTCQVELSNGHRLLAFRTGKARREPAGFAVGDRVKLRLSPYDLSEGRILGVSAPGEQKPG